MARKSGGAEGERGRAMCPSWAQGRGGGQAKGPSPWDFVTQVPRATAAWPSTKDRGHQRPGSGAGSATGLRQARPGSGCLTVTFEKGAMPVNPIEQGPRRGF